MTPHRWVVRDLLHPRVLASEVRVVMMVIRNLEPAARDMTDRTTTSDDSLGIRLEIEQDKEPEQSQYRT